MLDVLLATALLLGLAAFAAQVFGWLRSQASTRQHIARLVVLVVWGVASFYLLVVFIFFHYCENNCSSVLNPRALPIFAAIVAVDLAVIWLGLRGLSKVR
jgi:hypothetical protein